MVIGLAGRAFLVAVGLVVAAQDAVPGAVALVDQMLPAVLPQLLVGLPIALLAGARGQHGGGGQRFGLYPVVLVGVVERAVAVEAIDHAAVFVIPGLRERVIEKLLRLGQVPRLGRVAFQDQQQLGPFGLVAGLETPRLEDVAAVVEVVIPVHRPVGAVMLPHQSAGQRGLAIDHVLGQQFRPCQVARLAGGRIGGQPRLAGVHVGVLPAVVAEVPVRIRLVGVEAVVGVPEPLFHQLPGFVEPVLGLGDAGMERLGVGQRHERQAIAMLAGVGDHAIAQLPRIAAGLRVAMRLPKVIQAVLQRLLVRRVAERLPRHGVVVDEARAAYEMPPAAIVDAAVVAEVVKKTARRIDAPRVIETHDASGMPKQKFARAKIGERLAGSAFAECHVCLPHKPGRWTGTAARD